MELFDGQSTGVSIRECARQLGVSDTAIRKAIALGRCAKLLDGTVDVDAVRAGMAGTANQFRGGKRQAGTVGTPQTFPPLDAPEAPRAAAPGPAAAPKAPAAQAAVSEAAAKQALLLSARLSTEQTRAEREAIELAQLKGTVVELVPMVRGLTDAMVEARSAIMSLPDRLTPIVTPEADAGKVYAAIESEVLRICGELQAKFARLSKPANADE